jgi:hypothetical protein
MAGASEIETGEAADAEYHGEPLEDLLVRYQRASAEERHYRDAFIAGCRDYLHSALKMVGPIDPKMIHAVIDKLDSFLNHAGGRRK